MFLPKLQMQTTPKEHVPSEQRIHMHIAAVHIIALPTSNTPISTCVTRYQNNKLSPY